MPIHDSPRLITVDEFSIGQRLDNYLVKQLKGVPKSHIYRIIRKGEVRVNKGRKKAESFGVHSSVPPRPLPHVATSYSNIGVVYREKGDLENASSAPKGARDPNTRVQLQAP